MIVLLKKLIICHPSSENLIKKEEKEIKEHESATEIDSIKKM